MDGGAERSGNSHRALWLRIHIDSRPDVKEDVRSLENVPEVFLEGKVRAREEEEE